MGNRAVLGRTTNGQQAVCAKAGGGGGPSERSMGDLGSSVDDGAKDVNAAPAPAEGIPVSMAIEIRSAAPSTSAGRPGFGAACPTRS